MFSLILAPLWDAGGAILLLLFGIALLVIVIVSILIIIIEAIMLWRWFNYGSLYGLVIWPFLLGLLALMMVLIKLPLPGLLYVSQSDKEPLFEGHDWIMLVLLVAIALRSAVWNIFQIVEAGHFTVLIWLGLAAMIGKVGGGLLADWLGWRRWAVSALLIAAPLLTFGGEYLITLSLGIALLQSATPARLALSAQLAPRRPATVSGLVFGLAITLGGVPFLTGPLPVLRAPPTILVTSICAGLILWWATTRKKVPQVYS